MWYWNPGIYYRCIDISISAPHSPFSFHASSPAGPLTLPLPRLPSASSSPDSFPAPFLRHRLLIEGVPAVLFSSLIHQPLPLPNIQGHSDRQPEHINQ